MQGIYSQKAVMSILDRHSVAPLKKLGQNFLIDENVVEKIAEAAVVCENVIEIGPGMGALTRKLAKKAKKLVAVELDSGMVKVLEETLSEFDNVTVLNADVLKTDFKMIADEYFNGEPFSVAGNLPYYITAKCILHVLDCKAKVLRFTAMVQREVADRLAASPGGKDYGALTASVRYFGGFDKLFNVSANCFYPKPDVESAIVSIEPKKAFEVDRENYSKTVRILFAMRRKTLLNNLKTGLAIPSKKAQELLEEAGLDPMARAETLSPEDFAGLTEIIFN
ncbi:MAG: 16S rRNA (adenine(1518)-N(6)/adenine(1519)-N(6))-dimethyltransferase RsmA [Christensenellaceae bacterium]|nr:16S rRNA (adenine(1518)-N(6)/adenine(1519)-N(6))-dimethyltransferase RsmA [Christensenellaceae bacterium]